METRARASALEPNPSSVDLRRLAAAVFEGLAGRNETGAAVPQLAANWAYDGSKREWQFSLRPNVKGHDGTVVTPALLAETLSGLLSPRVVSTGADSLTIQCGQAEPGLIEDLAEPRFRLARTGPFKVAEWLPGLRGLLHAHETHWQGRPYLNAIEVRMGGTLRDQLFDFEGGRADVVELSRSDSRRQAGQPGRDVWSSAPLDLVALVFVRVKPSGRKNACGVGSR